jgi:hypothetical protein
MSYRRGRQTGYCCLKTEKYEAAINCLDTAQAGAFVISVANLLFSQYLPAAPVPARSGALANTALELEVLGS